MGKRSGRKHSITSIMKFAVLFCALISLQAVPSRAGTLLFESFETYNRGTLDADSPGDTNTSPNGGPGNPWWGVYPPDLRVVGLETNVNSGISTNIVAPHSGTNMVRGRHSGAADYDQDYFNLAYRLNHGSPFTNNLTLDWWFFDPVGARTNANSAPQYRDYVSLASWTAMPGYTDYFTNADGAADPGFTNTQLSLGAADSEVTGYRSTNYQAQIFRNNVSGDYDTNNGWFNLPIIRSIGWHHAEIVVSAPGTNGVTPVAFFIDNLTNALMTNNALITNGLNCIVLNAEIGNLTGYYDDITFTTATLPSLNIALTNGSAVISWAATNWTLQSSTDTVSSDFLDLSNAVSPFTNTFTDPTRYFRLRQ
jgi:hypothetical protein